MDNTISLLIPCYKCEEFIEKTLDSALAQTDFFDEIICYVDGSPDETSKILKKYKEVKYPRMILVENVQNRGVTYSRNQLLKLAKSKFVSFQDSDDILHPEFVEKMRIHLKENTMTACFWELHGLHGNKRLFGKKIDNNDNSIEHLFANFYHLNSAIFHRDFLIEIGGFLEEISFYDDRELLFRSILSGGRLQIVADVLAYWIQRPQSLMRSSSWEQHNKSLFEMATNLNGLFLKQDREIQSMWGRYIEQKMQMAYFNGGCMKYFDELQAFASIPDSKLRSLLSQVIGYKNYLRVLKLYSKVRGYL